MAPSKKNVSDWGFGPLGELVMLLQQIHQSAEVGAGSLPPPTPARTYGASIKLASPLNIFRKSQSLTSRSDTQQCRSQ